ncbi:MAG: V-type ATP synthase subunit I [Verrucomicrobiota bacterium]|nr:V-type ATP synthase subunit I [Verrucomicrobiota bacterium]
MIVKMHKYLIYGAKEEMSRFFELSQRAGFLEFIGVAHKKSLELPDEAKTILAAIRIARRHEIHPLEAPKAPADPVELAKILIDYQSQYEQLLEEKRVLSTEIARIAPFGDFHRDDLEEIEQNAKRVLQFFCMKSDLAREIVLPPEVLFVGTEYDLDYFVSVNKERAQYPKMIEIMIERPVGELKSHLFSVQENIARLESDIRHYSNALPDLQRGLTDLLNDHHLQLAKHDAAEPFGSSLFVIEAWVPETKVKSLFALLSGLRICAEEIAIEEKDKIPTCMENTSGGKIGEDIVHLYDIPSPEDKDPSWWVLLFFALFFAMIIADAGYGLIFLFTGLYFRWKARTLSAVARRFTRLVLILAVACTLWGFLTASFFGLEIGPNNPYRRFSLIHTLASKKAEYHLAQKDDVYDLYVKEYPDIANAKDGHQFLVDAATTEEGVTKYEALETFYDNILLEVSLLVGILHLSLSLLRYAPRNWANIGWVLFMIGGYLYFPKILDSTTIANFTGLISKPTAFAWGQQLVFGGIAFAFFASLIQRKWAAFHEVTNVIQVFADVLSYLRLYALALASIKVAETFNHMGSGFGLFFGAIIILVGHLVNISLSIMGATIHGLRLNFLEWYHYSFAGDGRLFNPLRLKKTK